VSEITSTHNLSFCLEILVHTEGCTVHMQYKYQQQTTTGVYTQCGSGLTEIGVHS